MLKAWAQPLGEGSVYASMVFWISSSSWTVSMSLSLKRVRISRLHSWGSAYKASSSRSPSFEIVLVIAELPWVWVFGSCLPAFPDRGMSLYSIPCTQANPQLSSGTVPRLPEAAGWFPLGCIRMRVQRASLHFRRCSGWPLVLRTISSRFWWRRRVWRRDGSLGRAVVLCVFFGSGACHHIRCVWM